MAEIEGALLEKWLLLIQARLDQVDHKLAAIDDHLAYLARESSQSRTPSYQTVYQVPYQDLEHNGGQPLKTVLLDKHLPPMPCAFVPMLGRILSVLEARTSVRQRQGESMADDLIAILKRDQE